MACGALANATRAHSGRKRALNSSLVQMVTSALARFSLDVDPSSRKHKLPSPVAIGARQLTRECIRQWRATHSAAQIALKPPTRPLEMYPERGHCHPRQRNSPVPVSLPASHQDLSALEVDVLHAQLRALGYSESASIHETRAEARNSTHPCKDRSYFTE